MSDDEKDLEQHGFLPEDIRHLDREKTGEISRENIRDGVREYLRGEESEDVLRQAIGRFNTVVDIMPYSREKMDFDELVSELSPDAPTESGPSPDEGGDDSGDDDSSESSGSLLSLSDISRPVSLPGDPDVDVGEGFSFVIMVENGGEDSATATADLTGDANKTAERSIPPGGEVGIPLTNIGPFSSPGAYTFDLELTDESVGEVFHTSELDVDVGEDFEGESISIVRTTSPGQAVLPGESYSIGVVVENTGDQPGQVSAAFDGPQNGSDDAELAPGEEDVLEIDVKASSPGEDSYTVSVSGADGEVGSDSISVTVESEPAPEFEIRRIRGPMDLSAEYDVHPNESYALSVEVENVGDEDGRVEVEMSGPDEREVSRSIAAGSWEPVPFTNLGPSEPGDLTYSFDVTNATEGGVDDSGTQDISVGVEDRPLPELELVCDPPDTATPDGSFTLSGVVRNVGDADTGRLRVVASYGGQDVRLYDDSLSPGAEAEYSETLPVPNPPDGSDSEFGFDVSLTAIATPSGEEVRANDECRVTVEPTPPAEFELDTPISVDVDPDDSLSVEVGVVNVGGQADSATVELGESAVGSTSQTVNVPPGETRDVTLAMSPPAPGDDLDYFVRVDGHDENTISVQTLGEGEEGDSDFIITDISPPDHLDPDGFDLS